LDKSKLLGHIDEEGVQRFPQNGLHKHLVDTNQVDLDRLGSDFQEGKFTLEEYAGFYRGIGYSVCSYMDIFE